MSTDSNTLTVQTLLSGWLRNCSRMYAADLKYISDDQFTTTAGGATRSAQEFTAECAGFCAMATAVVGGADMTPPDEDKRAAFGAQFTDKETSGQLLIQMADQLADAVDAASDEQMNRMIVAPWGAPMAVANLVNICGNHIMYHDGHVTYMQMIQGDGEMHWFEAFETASA